MMTRADRNAVLVEDLAHLFGGDFVGDERYHARFLRRRTDKKDARDSGERFGRIGQQRALMRRDIFHADPIEIVHRGAEADRRTEGPGTGFEARWRICEGAVLEGHALNHVAAALPWR